ncbi:MAG: Ldh family oxidoreductase, partial [Gemmatimonadota bacterium]
AYDLQGRPARDAEAFSLLAPFGEGGTKGFALAVALDILAGVLSGSLFARQITSGPGSRGCGHFFLALDPGRFMPLQDFGKRMEEMIAQTKGAQMRSDEAGPIFLPGERGSAKKEQGLREGVPLADSTLHLLDGLAEELNLEPVGRANPGGR